MKSKILKNTISIVIVLALAALLILAILSKGFSQPILMRRSEVQLEAVQPDIDPQLSAEDLTQAIMVYTDLDTHYDWETNFIKAFELYIPLSYDYTSPRYLKPIYDISQLKPIWYYTDSYDPANGSIVDALRQGSVEGAAEVHRVEMNSKIDDNRSVWAVVMKNEGDDPAPFSRQITIEFLVENQIPLGDNTKLRLDYATRYEHVLPLLPIYGTKTLGEHVGVSEVGSIDIFEQGQYTMTISCNDYIDTIENSLNDLLLSTRAYEFFRPGGYYERRGYVQDGCLAKFTYNDTITIDITPGEELPYGMSVCMDYDLWKRINLNDYFDLYVSWQAYHYDIDFLDSLIAEIEGVVPYPLSVYWLEKESTYADSTTYSQIDNIISDFNFNIEIPSNWFLSYGLVFADVTQLMSEYNIDLSGLNFDPCHDLYGDPSLEQINTWNELQLPSLNQLWAEHKDAAEETTWGKFFQNAKIPELMETFEEYFSQLHPNNWYFRAPSDILNSWQCLYYDEHDYQESPLKRLSEYGTIYDEAIKCKIACIYNAISLPNITGITITLSYHNTMADQDYAFKCYPIVLYLPDSN